MLRSPLAVARLGTNRMDLELMYRLLFRAPDARHIMAAFLVFVLLGGCVSTLDLEAKRPIARPHRYLEVDGVELHVEVTGTGPAVVLVHGFGGSTFSWREIAPELSRDYRVIAIDLPGFGYSERPFEREPYRREAILRRLELVLDELGEARAHWVGHSYGGGLAAALAAERPERVRSLTLIDSTGPNYALERHRSIATAPALAFLFVRLLGLRSNFVARALRNSYADAAAVTPEIVEAYRDRLRVGGAVRAYRHLSTRDRDTESRTIELSEVEAPALVIWGRDDRVLPLAVGEAGVEALPNAAPLVSLERCGHSPMEEQPAAVLEHLRSFLAAHTEQRPKRDT